MRLQVESTTASEIVGSSTSSRMKRSAPVSVIAMRSRTATPAVLCEAPRAISSLIAAPPRARCLGLRGASCSARSASSTSSRSMRASLEAMITTYTRINARKTR